MESNMIKTNKNSIKERDMFVEDMQIKINELLVISRLEAELEINRINLLSYMSIGDKQLRKKEIRKRLVGVLLGLEHAMSCLML